MKYLRSNSDGVQAGGNYSLVNFGRNITAIYQSFPLPFDGSSEHSSIPHRQPRFCENNNIKSCKLILMQPETLAYHTLDKISVYRTVRVLLGDSQSQTRNRETIPAAEKGEEGITGFYWPLKHPVVITRC